MRGTGGGAVKKGVGWRESSGIDMSSLVGDGDSGGEGATRRGKERKVEGKL